MGFRFYRRIGILPGVRLNVSGSGMSASIGKVGAWFTAGHGRAQATLGLPGSGMRYTSQVALPKAGRPAHVWVIMLVIVAILGIAAQFGP